ncbi:MAG: hypothetical protein KQH63_16490 [Desulfobulbaceae bacterium]|nr:hypothetical protein [Desulfobulbaceae bacterium]
MMKRKRRRRLCVVVANILIFGGLLFPASIWAESSSASFSLKSSVLSGGGGSMNSASFESQSTVGQPTPIMDADDIPAPPQSVSYNSYPGYWYTLGAESGCEDLGAFAATYGLTSADVDFNRACDFDKDNDIDGLDLAELI